MAAPREEWEVAMATEERMAVTMVAVAVLVATATRAAGETAWVMWVAVEWMVAAGGRLVGRQVAAAASKRSSRSRVSASSPCSYRCVPHRAMNRSGQR